MGISHKQVLPPQPRKLALLAASIHLGEGRGLLVSDLIKLGLGKDNARKKMYDSMANGLFAPDKIRIGHEKQYFLPNYKYVIDSKRRLKEQHADDSLIHKDLILQLLIALSNKKYTYHNIRLETSLNYLEEYNLFKWGILVHVTNKRLLPLNLNQGVFAVLLSRQLEQLAYR